MKQVKYNLRIGIALTGYYQYLKDKALRFTYLRRGHKYNINLSVTLVVAFNFYGVGKKSPFTCLMPTPKMSKMVFWGIALQRSIFVLLYIKGLEREI